ncbi:MAG: choice-of-anchor D domain-containing protein [Candidatus Kapaibacterium sp.]
MKHLCTLFICLASVFHGNAQSLSLFDVDPSGFPTVKAKFYAFDAAGQQQRPSISELTLTENGIPRTITNVSCPSPLPPKALSSVLVMDVSGSMGVGAPSNMEIAKGTAKVWVNNLLSGQSECAITSFDGFNYLNKDYTDNKAKLFDALTILTPQGGTDYDAALISPKAGALQIIKKGKYAKILILITDGLSTGTEDSIISEANRQNCAIYCVTIGMNAPIILKNIAKRTGGQVFENITTVQKAEEVSRIILETAQGNSPCEIEWISGITCNSANKSAELKLNNQTSIATYSPAVNAIPFLQVSPSILSFGKKLPMTVTDTTITLTAHNGDFVLTGIKLNFGSAAFSVVNTSFPITIPKNTSTNIILRFAPTDSNSCFASFEILNDMCPAYFSSVGGFPGVKMKTPTLKLLKPNGGESFVIGSDTLITWEGISPSDTVTLQYSIDNGANWNLLTNKATGLKYIWKNIPKPTSTKCLVKIIQGENGRNYEKTPTIEWQKKYGGTNNDAAHSIQQTIDGGYIVAGEATSTDGDVIGKHGFILQDFWILKLNSIGALEWQKTLGGTSFEYANCIQQTLDGGYIAVGYTSSNDGDITENKGYEDVWIIKLNSLGTVEWQKTFGGNSYDRALSIQQTKDGGYIFTGHTMSNDGDVSGNKGGWDVWTVKLNPVGVVEWQKTYGGTKDDIANSIQLTNDGGYIITGYSYSNDLDLSDNKGLSDFLIIKITSTGILEWQKTYGGTKEDYANSIQQTNDGGYIVVGYTFSNDGDITNFKGVTDWWVLKLTSKGMIEWNKSIGGNGSDDANSIQQTSDGGYVVAGCVYSKDWDTTYSGILPTSVVVKLTPNGAIEWQKPCGEECALSVKQTNDNGYIVAGFGRAKGRTIVMLISKLSPEGGYLQADSSDAVFSIVSPSPLSHDLDMKQCIVGGVKDSVITSFISNAGSYKYRVDSIYFQGSDAGSFALVSGIPQYELGVGAVKPTEFRFIPQRPGLHTATINIITQSDTLHQTIIGEGIAPILAIVNNLIDFGKVVVNSSKDTLQAFTIKNIGSAPLTITAIHHVGPNDVDFTTLNSGNTVNIAPGEIGKIDLQFSPKDVGRTSGRLLFDYNGIGSPAAVVLFGEGIIKPSITSTAEITFDSVCIGQRKTISAIVKNEGRDSIQLLRAEWNTNDGNVFTTNLQQQMLAADSSITLPIDFSPTTPGSALGEVRWIADQDTAFTTITGIGKNCATNLDTARTTIIAPNITAKSGEKVNLTLKLLKPIGMAIVGAPTEWQARIHYNSSILFIENLSTVCTGTTDSCALELTGVYDPTTDELISIPCVTTLGNTDYSPIIIDTFFWKNSAIVTEVATQNGSITLNGVCEDGGVRLFIPAKTSTSLSTRPNPAQDNLQIQYGLREPLTVTLELLTMTGQVVQTILTNQTQVAGQYTLTSDLSVLGNGVYLLRMRTNKVMLTTRVDVVK